MRMVSPMLQLSMKCIMRASAQKYITCSLNTFVDPHSCYLGLQLKLLYHGITRARNKLWIVDGSVSGGPMKVPETPVIQKILLTPSVGILE